MVPFEKSKIVSFTSSIMKNIVVFSTRSKFVVKMICCIAFGLESRAGCLLKPIAINVQCSLKYPYNLVNNRLCNHPPDQLQFFECYNTLLNYFLLVYQRSFFHQS